MPSFLNHAAARRSMLAGAGRVISLAVCPLSNAIACKSLVVELFISDPFRSERCEASDGLIWQAACHTLFSIANQRDGRKLEGAGRRVAVGESQQEERTTVYVRGKSACWAGPT